MGYWLLARRYVRSTERRKNDPCMRSWKMDMGNNEMPKFLVARQDQAREHVLSLLINVC
jgi:hypothetical protein